MPKTYTLGEAKRILRAREKVNEEFINERLTDEVKEQLLDRLTPEFLRQQGKRCKRRANKDLKRSTLCFELADINERRLRNVAA